MPSLCSSRSTVMPGVPLGTTNDLIAARPEALSSVAHTTTASAALAGGDVDLLAVEDVLVAVEPAVVAMLAESEPAPGSVIAIAAHSPANRSACSSSATEAMAELPRPWRGIESSRPVSPQHISAIDSTDARLVPLRTRPSSSSASSRRTPAAPAPSLGPGLGEPVDHRGEHVELHG